MSINVYEMVTNRIIEQLENNIVPWEKPWHGTIDGAFNRVSKKPYSILNQMLLKYDGEYASFQAVERFRRSYSQGRTFRNNCILENVPNKRETR